MCIYIIIITIITIKINQCRKTHPAPVAPRPEE